MPIEKKEKVFLYFLSHNSAPMPQVRNGSVLVNATEAARYGYMYVRTHFNCYNF